MFRVIRNDKRKGGSLIMSQHKKINYIELPSKDLAKTKFFFTSVFHWSFKDYGPEYCAIEDAGIDGGFYVSDKTTLTSNGSALIVIYSNNLESTLDEVLHYGGSIVKPVFSFPGGRRFHFLDPNGNEFAVWSDLNS